ncbi:hypothetical protein [Methylobacterium nodulans]|uniref:Uncharacterized protein n=1 Tax=Methylobacterium nodulans (strain LMG 21967 / CNCM I-2342 / ORS 2060) TaxID=460265 RepID=B8IC07_METNO|nr:hypothetical protein [Methylobacterium nodulans]ACL61189.1 hypothetical protein Mnod_6404 [Methylobacterium nodulans ORS 2060]
MELVMVVSSCLAGSVALVALLTAASRNQEPPTDPVQRSGAPF